MKLNANTTAHFLATTLIALSPSAFAAQEVVVSSSQKAPWANADSRATVACVNAFAAQIIPNSQYRVRFSGNAVAPVFMGHNPPRRMMLQMTARARGSYQKLASGVCTVAKDSRVEELTVTVNDSARLAALPLRELQLVASAR